MTFKSVVRGALAICIAAGFWYLQAKTGGELPEEWQSTYFAVLFLVVIPAYLLWQRHRSRAFRQAAARLGMTAGADGQGIRLPFSVLRHEPSPSNMFLGQRGEQRDCPVRIPHRNSQEPTNAHGRRIPVPKTESFRVRAST